ncbi:hypothetical protein IF188_17710 [Microbacterium sp. NEAU-LLC]|uniref:Uncharacterized protein n=1 Tax=Microbacterium helvum TaxID=2773713 RepID=A0ABR8NSB5_9MICO|nr:hypothetical protein [Microbacterium helvum]MBD3943531.1 hypothetical protein [Microbacterium helvum]
MRSTKKLWTSAIVALICLGGMGILAAVFGDLVDVSDSSRGDPLVGVSLLVVGAILVVLGVGALIVFFTTVAGKRDEVPPSPAKPPTA